MAPELHTIDRLSEAPLANIQGTLSARAQQLSWLEAKSRALLDASLDAVVVLDNEGKILELSSSAEFLFGYEQQELEGRSWEGTLLPIGSDFRRPHATRRVETVAQRADGSEFPVELVLRAVEHVRRPAFACVFRDVTAERKAEELRLMQHRIIQVLASEKDPALAIPTVLETLCGAFAGRLANLWLPDGNGRLQLTYSWGPAPDGWPTSLGEGEDLPGRTWMSGEPTWVRNLATCKNLPRYQHLRGAGLRGAAVFPISYSGILTGVLELFTPEPLPKQEAGVADQLESLGLEIGQFITRQQTEETLVRAKRAAEAANLARSTFLAAMSHELRTPMNGILGMTDLVLDTELSAEQRECLNLSKSSAESLLSVIDEILDFSLIEAGKLELQAIPFDLAASLSVALQALQLRAEQKGLKLTFQIAPGIPQTVVGDPGRIRQICSNLVGNAIKFTEQGHVMVAVTPVTDPTGQVRMRFAVRDTGIGIPLRKQKLIFKAFGQVDDSSTRKHGGTGLGLAICKKLTSLMGGNLALESTPDKGSTFTVTIPLKVPSEPFPSVMPLAVDALKGISALVVDGNSAGRRALERSLKRWGMLPVAVESGRAAIDAARTGHFGLVLMDSRFADMDGFTLASQFRANGPCTGTPIMLLTSSGQLGDAARCREIGIEAYLTKPVPEADLLEAICRTLGTHAAGSIITRHTLRENSPRWNILLAEDSSVNRTLATRLLEKRGHRVTPAENGRLAVEAVQQQQFDLILMDIQMPEMDGHEATAAIRALGGEVSRTPIIALTAHALAGDREDCLQRGMDGYATKPIRAEELYREMDTVMRITQ